MSDRKTHVHIGDFIMLCGRHVFAPSEVTCERCDARVMELIDFVRGVARGEYGMPDAAARKLCERFNLRVEDEPDPRESGERHSTEPES